LPPARYIHSTSGGVEYPDGTTQTHAFVPKVISPVYTTNGTWELGTISALTLAMPQVCIPRGGELSDGKHDWVLNNATGGDVRVNCF
jgi:hypothetical protein